MSEYLRVVVDKMIHLISLVLDLLKQHGESMMGVRGNIGTSAPTGKKRGNTKIGYQPSKSRGSEGIKREEGGRLRLLLL